MGGRKIACFSDSQEESNGDSLEKCNATSKILCDWISDDGVAFYFGIEVKSGAGRREQAL
eukprot:scaffold26275_cov132-Skeletonema_dohrnii-CCMP3373.AAC.2